MHPDEERWWIELIRRLDKLISVAQETHKAVDALSKRLNAAFRAPLSTEEFEQLPKTDRFCNVCGCILRVSRSGLVCMNGHGQ